MKLALCLTTLLAGVCLSWAVTPEYNEKFTAAINDCLKEHHVDKKDIIVHMKENKIPDTKEYKCFAGCTMDKMGIVKDLSIDWEAVKASNPQKYDTPELVEKANQVADTCAKVVTAKASDICELAVPVIKCCLEEGKKVQLPKPDFKYE